MKRTLALLLLLVLLASLGGCGAATPTAVPTAVATGTPPAATPPAPTRTAPPPTAAPTSTPSSVRSDYPLSGLAIGPEGLRWPPIVAMIPSDSDTYGMSQASVVYEAVVEYQIPRFMAIFEQVDAEKIGPVRSARPYFVDWACPYGPLYVHWGGSPQALSLLAQRDCLRPLDGQTYGAAYFRHEENSQVPWNSEYISSDMLYKYLQNWEITRTIDFRGYAHKDDAPLASRPLTGTISFSFGDPVRYSYDPQDNSYRRDYQGRPHLDALTGMQYRVKNVVVIFVPTAPLAGDDQGRMDVQTTGEGEALVFQDGRELHGRWVKEAPEVEMRFFDEQGQEVVFNRGNIWIEVLAPGQQVEVSFP